jgi:hypothetical protein
MTLITRQHMTLKSHAAAHSYIYSYSYSYSYRQACIGTFVDMSRPRLGPGCADAGHPRDLPTVVATSAGRSRRGAGRSRRCKSCAKLASKRRCDAAMQLICVILAADVCLDCILCFGLCFVPPSLRSRAGAMDTIVTWMGCVAPWLAYRHDVAKAAAAAQGAAHGRIACTLRAPRSLCDTQTCEHRVWERTLRVPTTHIVNTRAILQQGMGRSRYG